jgi:DNA-directed RNA polymerase subunit RPC12/RpoP
MNKNIMFAGLTELQQACKDVLDQRDQIVSVTPRKGQRPLMKQPAANQSLSSKKRNMLERIPPNEQLPIILNEDSVAAGDAKPMPTKIVVKREEDDEEDNAEEMDLPEGEAGEMDEVGKQVETGTYRCTKCNKDLPYGTSLFRHELRHKMFPGLRKKGTGKFQCTKCPKRFATKNARNMHERNHNKEPKFKCPHCDEKFFFEFILDKHLIKDHPDLEPDLVNAQLPCDAPDCTKTFASEALLRIHRSRKHGLKDESARPDKPIPCDLCGKEVLWLAEHKKSVHPEEVGEKREDHTCPECGKVMKYASSLKRHMYLHQEGGAVQCPHCDKPFNHPSSLWSHFPSCPKVIHVTYCFVHTKKPHFC